MTTVAHSAPQDIKLTQIPHASSRAHFLNLPSEILHHISSFLDSDMSRRGVSSVFNLAIACKQMRLFALDRGRLADINKRYVTFDGKAAIYLLAWAMLPKQLLLRDAATAGLVQRIGDNALENGDFHLALEHPNEEVQRTAKAKRIDNIRNAPVNEESIRSVLTFLESEDANLSAAAEHRLITWFDALDVNPLDAVFNQLVSHQSDALAATFTSALIAKCYQPIEAFTQSINLFHLGSTNPDVYGASKTYVLKALSRVSLDVQSSSVEFLLQTNDNDIQFAVSQQLKQSMSANKNNPNYIIGYMLNPVYLQSNIQNIRQVALDNHLKECKRTGDYSILKSADFSHNQNNDVCLGVIQGFKKGLYEGDVFLTSDNIIDYLHFNDSTKNDVLNVFMARQRGFDQCFSLLSHACADVRRAAVNELLNTFGGSTQLDLLLSGNTSLAKSDIINVVAKRIRAGEFDGLVNQDYFLLKPHSLLKKAAVNRLAILMADGRASLRVPKVGSIPYIRNRNEAFNKACDSLIVQTESLIRGENIDFDPKRLFSLVQNRLLPPVLQRNIQTLIGQQFAAGAFDKIIMSQPSLGTYPHPTINESAFERLKQLVEMGECDAALKAAVSGNTSFQGPQSSSTHKVIYALCKNRYYNLKWSPAQANEHQKGLQALLLSTEQQSQLQVCLDQRLAKRINLGKQDHFLLKFDQQQAHLPESIQSAIWQRFPFAINERTSFDVLLDHRLLEKAPDHIRPAIGGVVLKKTCESYNHGSTLHDLFTHKAVWSLPNPSLSAFLQAALRDSISKKQMNRKELLQVQSVLTQGHPSLADVEKGLKQWRNKSLVSLVS